VVDSSARGDSPTANCKTVQYETSSHSSGIDLDPPDVAGYANSRRCTLAGDQECILANGVPIILLAKRCRLLVPFFDRSP